MCLSTPSITQSFKEGSILQEFYPAEFLFVASSTARFQSVLNKNNASRAATLFAKLV